jgi:hypothetical protein
MKTTARLIITFDCNRNCPDCCNKTDPSVKTAKITSDLSILKDYEAVCITGGEPMLQHCRTIQVIKQLKHNNPDQIIYLYTAMYTHILHRLIRYIDGIHYTIHYPALPIDINRYFAFASMIALNQNKSYRLYIDNRVFDAIIIQPSLWHRVEIKPWMKECSLPVNEDLYILK